MFWKKKSKGAFSPEWGDVLGRCNFYLARREFAEFLRLSNEDAKAKGGYAAYPERKH